MVFSWSASSLMSKANLESFFIKFVFDPSGLSPRPIWQSDVPVPIYLFEREALNYVCISEINLSLMTELMGLLT